MTSEKKIPPTGQGPARMLDPIGKDRRKPAQRKRRWKVFFRRVASDPAPLAKIDLQAPKLITTQATIKEKEEDRRFDRINDIGNMLAKNGALSEQERRWIRDLHDTDYESFKKLGRLLSVPKYWSLSESRVKNLEDRNKIRMQTLKAAAFEALKTAGSDTTAEQKKQTIDRALKKATAVRWALNQRFPRYADGIRRLMGQMLRGQTELRKAMTQKFVDREVKLYEVVSETTLRNPERLYGPYGRGLANDNLSKAVEPSGEIDRKIKKKVANAVNTLVKNGLLNQRAAVDLLDALKTNPETVNALMSHADKWVRRGADREKVKSLMLLALAYGIPRDDASRRRLQNIIHVLLIRWRSDGRLAKRDVNTQLEVRWGYRWLPDFPRSNTLNELDHDRLLSWATTGALNIAASVVRVKKPEVKIRLYEADPPPPTVDDDEAAPPPDPSDSKGDIKDDIPEPSARFNSADFGSVEPPTEEPLIEGRTLEDWLLEDMPIDESILEAAEEQGGIEREDKNPDSNDLKTP